MGCMWPFNPKKVPDTDWNTGDSAKSAYFTSQRELLLSQRLSLLWTQ